MSPQSSTKGAVADLNGENTSGSRAGIVGVYQLHSFANEKQVAMEMAELGIDWVADEISTPWPRPGADSPSSIGLGARTVG